MPPRYYVPELVSPLTRLKYRLIDKRRPMPDGPEHVQIQTVSGCNASCIFCPNKKTELQIPFGRKMSKELYESIVDQITEMPSVRRMSPYLMNESTLDPELPARIAYFTKKKKPHQYTKINSHGNALTERMMHGIMEAGLDRINFSVQGIDPKDYEEVMALKFDKTVRNIERMIQIRDENKYKTRIRVVMLVTSYLKPKLPEIKAFWKDRGVKIHLNRIENRGRHTNIKTSEIAVREMRVFDWCERMFNQIYILWDGRMVMCCADWEQTGIMGDCSKDTIHNIWHGEKYRQYRKNYLEGTVKGMLCDGCTKDGERGDGDEDD